MGPQPREYSSISTIPISQTPPPPHQLHAAMFPIRGRLSDPITTFREKSGSLSSIKSGKFSSSKKDLVRETAQTAYQSIKERALMQGSGSVSGSPGRIQVTYVPASPEILSHKLKQIKCQFSNLIVDLYIKRDRFTKGILTL